MTLAAVQLVPAGDPLVNLELEAALLGVLMQSNEAVDAVADVVSADHFSEPLHGRVYQTIVHEVFKGKQANPVTLKGYFDRDEAMLALGGPVYLMKLAGNAVSISPYACASELADLALRRRMRNGLQAVAGDCSDLTVPASEIVTRADEAVSVTASDAIHQPEGWQCIDELFASYKDGRSGVLCRSIACVDELLGPMRPKQLVIGAGRPGMGKTAFALSYALGAAQAGHGVLFVSLEMSSTELAARMVADLCFDGGEGVPFNCIRDGELNQWQQRRMAEASSRMRGLPFRVIDAGSLTVGRLNMLIRRHARRMEADGFKLELVVVDYLQLLSPDGRGKSTYEAVSEVSRALKAMAKDNDLSILALAQLSRSVEQRADKRPQLSDLRDSGQIEQDADAVLFLLRNEYYLRQAEPDMMSPERAQWEAALEQHKGVLEFIVAKRRNGVTGSATGAFHGAYQAVRG